MDHVTPNASAHYALQVALQTMKERCVALEKRVSTVEYENHTLRERLAEKNSSQDFRNSESLMENNQLRLEIIELQRQKSQLSERLTMVSNENLKLWSRLSQISKEEEKNESNDTTLVNETEVPLEGSPKSTIHQNLIRSKTFTQHSPNPNLRRKLISNKITSYNDTFESDLSKMSLEEVTLNRKNSLKSQSLEDGTEDTAEDAIGFGYLNDYNEDETSGNDVDEVEINAQLKKLVESFQEMKRLAKQQYEEMDLTKQAILNQKASRVCKECIVKSQKPEMADKSLETDDSLNDPKNIPIAERPHVKIFEEASFEKICPICGKIYNENVTFGAFQEHVEYHFIDETSDLEQSIERNFELTSHTVGDF